MANGAKASAELQDVISGFEVDMVGIVSLEKYKGTRLEEQALRLLPTARSVVVLALEIYRDILEHAALGKKIDGAPMRDFLQSHTDFISGELNEVVYDLARASRKMKMKALPLPSRGLPFDSRRLTAVFSYKHTAQAAGMGSIGRHSMLITPDFGPRIRLACCLTEAILEPTAKGKTYKCGKCHVCIGGCPSGALEMPEGEEPYRINKFACNSYRAGGFCSECMRLCPPGRK